uniref:(California timema) hypothetical protein n=1 Tax=Timema californicum TaxID=61474 RepID=A0A7R9P333_TIMCA|nr:unnamed protein product [Timema californicum]
MHVHPTKIRTSISPSSAVELNTTSALANYATEAVLLDEEVTCARGKEREWIKTEKEEYSESFPVAFNCGAFWKLLVAARGVTKLLMEKRSQGITIKKSERRRTDIGRKPPVDPRVIKMGFRAQGYSNTWEELQKRLQKRFDSPPLRVKLQAELYGEAQTAEESTDYFILRIMRLYKRFFPTTLNEQILPLISELLHPTIRPFITSIPPTSVDQLLESTVAVQRNILPSTHHEQPKPLLLGPLLSTRPPPQCNFCPAQHFHRECPVLLARRTTPTTRRTNHTANLGNGTRRCKRGRTHLRSDQQAILSSGPPANLHQIPVRTTSKELRAVLDSGASQSFVRASALE